MYAGHTHSCSLLIPFREDYVMKKHRAPIMFCLCAVLCHAQTTKTDQALLNQARDKYDAPFNRNLRSFDCAVDFSWKEHFTETTRVGDEGTDEELETIFQPIRNRVTMTSQNVTVSSGLTDDAIAKLPHGGMAELLLEHAVRKSISIWWTASTNTIFPDPGTPVSFEQSPSGYKLIYKLQGSDVDMFLDPDMRLLRFGKKAPQSNELETTFTPGQRGLVLTSLTMGENGNSEVGHRLIFSFTYQTVDGVEFPEHVSAIRESHHEAWRYTLNDCKVKTRK
jgi:hypothetical protein